MAIRSITFIICLAALLSAAKVAPDDVDLEFRSQELNESIQDITPSSAGPTSYPSQQDKSSPTINPHIGDYSVELPISYNGTNSINDIPCRDMPSNDLPVLSVLPHYRMAETVEGFGKGKFNEEHDNGPEGRKFSNITQGGGDVRAVLDRIEGEMAIILLGEDEMIKIDVPISLMPAGSREGDILDITFRKDEKATEEARESARATIERLKARSRQN
jgi:hypothetical protein